MYLQSHLPTSTFTAASTSSSICTSTSTSTFTLFSPTSSSPHLHLHLRFHWRWHWQRRLHLHTSGEYVRVQDLMRSLLTKLCWTSPTHTSHVLTTPRSCFKDSLSRRKRSRSRKRCKHRSPMRYVDCRRKIKHNLLSNSVSLTCEKRSRRKMRIQKLLQLTSEKPTESCRNCRPEQCSMAYKLISEADARQS